MIANRYEHAQIASVWTTRAKLQRWVMVERAIAVAGGFDELAATLKEFRPDSYFYARVEILEGQTKHEVTAFLQALERDLIKTPQINRLHWGATSSDLMDTDLALAVKIASALLVVDVQALSASLSTRILRAAPVKRMARTHGRAVYPSPLRNALSAHWFEIDRAMRSVDEQAGRMRGRISGPAGDYPILTEQDEERGLAVIGMNSDPAGTQLSSRDRLVAWLNAVSRLVTAYEKLATLIRIEAIEGVDGVVQVEPDSYTGSSAMPHKVNPTRAERICGLARLVRANARAVEDSSVPWADNSLEHSSVERIVLPLVSELAGYLTIETGKMLDEVSWVNQNEMPEGSFDSFRALHALLEKEPDLLRSEAYNRIKEEGNA